MKTLIRHIALAGLLLSPLAAQADPVVIRPPVCNVSESEGFLNYLRESKPTLVELKQIYTCLEVVMPGDITTSEYRTDNSRFFATLDAHNRIVGGSFR